MDNERYDDYNRWIGGINFAGQIFPKMSNYTPNNRATSIGNQLLSNYRKFLLAYEIAHRAKDLDVPDPSTTQVGAPERSCYFCDMELSHYLTPTPCLSAA